MQSRRKFSSADYVLLVAVAVEGAEKLAEALQQAGLQHLPQHAVATLAAAQAMLAASAPLLIVSGLQATDAEGMALLEGLRSIGKASPLLILAGAGDAGFETPAMEAGAEEFLFYARTGSAEMARAIQHACVHHRLLRDLAESRERLALAVEGASLGLWDWHVPSGHVTFDARWLEMLGYAPGQIEAHVSSWEKLVHPDDWPQISASLEPHLRGDSDWYESEHRLSHADEHWVWVLDRGRVVERDAEGKPLRMAGIHLDISARKAAEAALRERETRLETLLTSLPDAVFHIDTSGSLLYAHLPAGRWFVAAAALRIGTPYAKQLPGVVAATLDEALGNVLAESGKVQSGEFTVTVSGEARCYQLTVSQLADSGRFPSGFLAVFRDQTERRRHEEAIRNMAYYDALTNLPNRRLLLDRLRQAVAVCDRRKIFGALLFIDLDRFKELNDSCGHDIGDRYLIEIANRLRSCLRAGDTAARLGGDEFILMFPDLGARRGEAFTRVAAVCDKILPLLEKPLSLDDHEYCGSASIGAVLFDGDAPAPEDLLRRADLAMYQAKAAGRRAWRWADKNG